MGSVPHLKNGPAALVLTAAAAVVSITQAEGDYTSFDSVAGLVLLLLLWAAAPSLDVRNASARVHLACAAVVSLCITLTLAWPLSIVGWGNDNAFAIAWLAISACCWMAIHRATRRSSARR